MTPPPGASRQTDSSVEKNTSFFRNNVETYSSHVEMLDTYRNIRNVTNEALRGTRRLLDVGNGGTFDYDVQPIPELVAVDLFLEDLPVAAFPPNVRAKNGSALDLPEPDGSFDTVLMSMLFHHLIGKSPQDSIANISRALTEAFRVLSPGGKLVVVESCVPVWFYRFEKLVFPLASRLINLLMSHPATMQFPPNVILDLIREHTTSVEMRPIPTGRWILQYGFKFPVALTPAAPYCFVAQQRER
jgi:ubiquinone/menaquinone biosynthesis C-methylase UbiE